MYYNTHKMTISFITINLTTISNSLVIFSCFYDKRFYSIRLIGISSKNVNFKCDYLTENIYKSCNYKYVSLTKDSSGNKYSSKYINILIDQNNTIVPDIVMLDNKKFKVYNNIKIEQRNVLCITTFKNFVSYNLFFQSLNIYISYGITDVYIYTSDVTLKWYKFKQLQKIIVHVIYILNEFYLKTSFYFGQTVKYNDCLYRNMYKSNYIIFVDFDELIILSKIKSYDILLNSFNKGDIYYFKSTLCPTTSFIEKKNFHRINDTYLSKTLNCCMLESYYHRKYILKNSYKFIKINVHYVDYVYEKCNNIFVNEHNAYIHHSRIPTYTLINHCSKWFSDISLKTIIQTKTTFF